MVLSARHLVRAWDQTQQGEKDNLKKHLQGVRTEHQISHFFEKSGFFELSFRPPFVVRRSRHCCPRRTTVRWPPLSPHSLPTRGSILVLGRRIPEGCSAATGPFGLPFGLATTLAENQLVLFDVCGSCFVCFSFCAGDTSDVLRRTLFTCCCEVLCSGICNAAYPVEVAVRSSTRLTLLVPSETAQHIVGIPTLLEQVICSCDGTRRNQSSAAGVYVHRSRNPLSQIRSTNSESIAELVRKTLMRR